MVSLLIYYRCIIICFFWRLSWTSATLGGRPWYVLLFHSISACAWVYYTLYVVYCWYINRLGQFAISTSEVSSWYRPVRDIDQWGQFAISTRVVGCNIVRCGQFAIMKSVVSLRYRPVWWVRDSTGTRYRPASSAWWWEKYSWGQWLIAFALL